MRALLSGVILLCTGVSAANRDSLIHALDGLPRDSTRARALATVVWSFLRTDPDSALGFAREYLELAEDLHDEERIAKGHADVGRCLALMGDHDEALPHYLIALQWYERTGDRAQAAIAHTSIAEVYKAESRHELALAELRAAHAGFRSVQDTMWIAFTAEALASTFEELGMRDSAFAWFDRTASIMEAVDSPQHAAMVRFRQSTMLKEWGNDSLMRVMQEQALAMLGGSRDANARSIILVGLGRTLDRMGEGTMAERHLREALALASAGRFKKQLAEAHEALGMLFRRRAMADSALIHYTAYVRWHDSVYNEERSARIAEVQARFDDARKDAELEHSKVLIADQRSHITIYAGTALVLGVLALALVAVYRRDRRHARALEQRNAAVGSALKEKELLLRELNHRVKNNMQTVGSLLRLQARGEKDEGTREALQEAMMRVKSLALVHQDLYRDTALASVHMDEYISKLAHGLLRSQGMEGRIALRLEVAHVRLDVDTAVPLGLILNEMITNALKHAFPDARAGALTIMLKDDGDVLHLEVRDDGIGFQPERKDGGRNDASLSGAGILSTFAEALQADWSIRNEQGTAVRFAVRNFTRA